MLTVTLVCAAAFLGVKAVEYGHKWSEGLLWAGAYSTADADHHAAGHRLWRALLAMSTPAIVLTLVAIVAIPLCRQRGRLVSRQLWGRCLLVCVAYFGGVLFAHGVELWGGASHAPAQEAVAAESVLETGDAPSEATAITGVFFSIYFAMTGVHALHIVIGMGVIAWLLRRALAQEFGSDSYGPVDFVGLYWHLVDLVWIYLFPLLYLIR